MAARSQRILSLCSGIGGLDLGTCDALTGLGFFPRVVCNVEREAFAAAVLVSRMEKGELDQSAIWSDLATFDGWQWRDFVDGVVAGVPCQPHSTAGKRAGVQDGRWLWPEVERILRETGAGWFFLENVDGLRTSSGGEAFGKILEGLARVGLVRWRWIVLPASVAGSPQRRKRIFLLATRRGVEHAAPVGVLPGPGEVPLDAPLPSGGREGHGDAALGPGGGMAWRRLADASSDAGEVEAAGGEDGEGRSPAASTGGELACCHGKGWDGRCRSCADGSRCAEPAHLEPRMADAESGPSRPSDIAQGREPHRCPSGRPLADGDLQGCSKEQGTGLLDREPQCGDDTDGCHRQLADGLGKGLEGRPSLREDPATQRPPAERGRDGMAVAAGRRVFPPGPLDYGAWADLLERRPDLAPAFPKAQPEVRRVLDGAAVRLEPATRWRSNRLRALGNAVHPGQAEIAFTLLWRSLNP